MLFRSAPVNKVPGRDKSVSTYKLLWKSSSLPEQVLPATCDCSQPPNCERHADTATAAAKSLQSCPTLCDPIDGSPPGSPIPGILQARTLESVTISFSNA